MLPSKHYHRPRPEPGYARYMQVDVERTLLDGVTPYQGSLQWSAHTALRACQKQFSTLFEYVKFDELGVDEVVDWCERRFGRQFLHDRNTERQDANAKWWLVDDTRIAFSDPNAALEFKMRWV